MTSYITGLAGLGTATGGYWADNLGRPKLMLIDNPWALICNGGEWTSGDYQTEMGNYLSARAAGGFTGLYVAVLGCTDIGGSHDNGNTWDNVAPFTSGGDPSTGLSSTYWQRVDYLITTAESLGLTVWLNIAYSAQSGGGNMESGGALYNLTQAQYANYGTAVAERYAGQRNIVWMYGNDYYAGYEAAFGYIRSAIIATGDTHVMAVHNYPESTSRYDIETNTGAALSSTFSSGYSQVNWVYTYNVLYYGTELAYEEAAAHGIAQIPAVWGDGTFWGSGSYPYDQIMRQMTWWCLSSGGRGCNTGSNDIWPWGSGSPAAVTGDGNWYTVQAGIARTAIESLPAWYTLLPDTSSQLVTSGRGTHATGIATGDFYAGGTDGYVSASRTPDGTLAVIYCAKTFSITVNQSKMAPGYTATWLDPTDGAKVAATPGSTYDSAGLGNNSAGDPDWVLILQGPAASVPAPSYLYSMQRLP